MLNHANRASPIEVPERKFHDSDLGSKEQYKLSKVEYY